MFVAKRQAVTHFFASDGWFHHWRWHCDTPGFTIVLGFPPHVGWGAIDFLRYAWDATVYVVSDSLATMLDGPAASVGGNMGSIEVDRG